MSPEGLKRTKKQIKKGVFKEIINELNHGEHNLAVKIAKIGIAAPVFVGTVMAATNGIPSPSLIINNFLLYLNVGFVGVSTIIFGVVGLNILSDIKSFKESREVWKQMKSQFKDWAPLQFEHKK